MAENNALYRAKYLKITFISGPFCIQIEST